MEQVVDDIGNQLRLLTGACSSAVSLIHSDLSSRPRLIPLLSDLLYLSLTIFVGALQPCGSGAVQLHSAITYSLWRHTSYNVLSRINDLLRLSTTKLNAFPYRDVPLCWRRLYTDASILKAVVQINSFVDRYCNQDAGGERKICLDDEDAEIVKTLDMALIMAGAPGNGRQEVIVVLLAQLDSCVSEIEGTRERRSGKRKKPHASDSLLPLRPPPAPEIMHPIDRLDKSPSVERFQSHLNGANTPIIIANLVSHWPALTTRPWSSVSYLLSKTHRGRRLVPVELGKSYTTADWSQRIMTFKEFMDVHVLYNDSFSAGGGWGGYQGSGPQERPTGYLAQHTLFTQIPGLRHDIITPDYCYTTPPIPPTPSPPAQLEDPLVNAWLGPSGTISPLHTDPYSNILTQVLGRKYVRLYAPSETLKLFPRGIEGNGVDMGNTSQVDIDDEEMAGLGDERRYEEWKRASYIEGVLGAGEGLYIPVCSSYPKSVFFQLTCRYVCGLTDYANIIGWVVALC